MEGLTEAMTKGMTRRAWVAASGLTIAAGSALGWWSARRDETERGSRAIVQARHLPNVPLRTHDGTPVRFYDDLVKGKLVVINLFFTSCEDDCPITTANLVNVQRTLGARVGRDVFMYSITLDPDVDTPAVLSQYRRKFNVGPGWTYLTGKPADIDLLRRKLGYTSPEPEEDADKEFHINTVRYGNEPRQVWGAVPGLAAPAWIARSILFADRSPEALAKGAH